jgi:hypothetical protein
MVRRGRRSACNVARWFGCNRAARTVDLARDELVAQVRTVRHDDLSRGLTGILDRDGGGGDPGLGGTHDILQLLALPTKERERHFVALDRREPRHHLADRQTEHRAARDSDELVADEDLSSACRGAVGREREHVWPSQRQIAPKVDASHAIHAHREHARVF